MGVFKDFLNSVRVKDFDSIKTIQSRTLEHYGIKEFGLRIQEKQIIEFQKYKFIYVEDQQFLKFQMNNFQLLFKPKYVFEYSGDYYVVVKSKDWKKLTKYLLNVYNKPKIIIHFIVSVVCGLNEIIKNNLDYNFNNFDINNFYINIEKKEKGFYKFYEPKINKDLLFKSKYNIKYLGTKKEQLYRKIDLKTETLPFYNFLYSLQQFLKLYPDIYPMVDEYFRALTKNDNFLSFYDTDMQNYIINKDFYTTYEEILHLKFIIKTIGINYLKNLKKTNKQKQSGGTAEPESNKFKNFKNLKLVYEDINNMEHFENIIEYQEKQNNEEKNKFMLKRLNNGIDEILKVRDFSGDSSYSINRLNCQIESIMNKHDDYSISFKNSRFAKIVSIPVNSANDNGQFISTDFSKGLKEKNILYDPLYDEKKYRNFENFDFYNDYANDILQNHLTDRYDNYKLRKYLSPEPFDIDSSEDSDDNLNTSSSESSIDSDDYLKEYMKKQKIYVIDENDYITFLNNEINDILNHREFIIKPLKIKKNKFNPYHSSLNEYLSFLNNQINNELIKHETLKHYKAIKKANKNDEDMEIYKKTLDNYFKDSNKKTESSEIQQATEDKELINTNDYEKMINDESNKSKPDSPEEKKTEKKKQKKQGDKQLNCLSALQTQGGKKNKKSDKESNKQDNEDYYHQEYVKEYKKPESPKDSEDDLHIKSTNANLTNIMNESTTSDNEDYKDYEAYRLNVNSPHGIETDINNNIDYYLNSRPNLKTSEGGDGDKPTNNQPTSQQKPEDKQHWNKPNNQNNHFKPYNNQNNWQKNTNYQKSYNSQQNYNNPVERKNSIDGAKQENIKIANADVVPEFNPVNREINKKEDREVNDFVNEYKRQLETDKLKHLKTDAETSYYVVKKNALGLYGNTLTNLNQNYNMYYILDILPDKFNMSRFIFGNTNERRELIEYLKDFLINKSNGRDIDANSISSLFSMMKIINTYPEDYKGNEKSLKYQPKYNSITPDYVSFRSCYPLAIEKGQTKCAANSTMINVKLYNLKYYEDVTKNLYEPGLIYYDKKMDQKDLELIEKLNKDDPLITNRKTILNDKKYLNKSVSFNELKFYTYVKKNLIDTSACPHFPCLIGNKIVTNDVVNPDFITAESMYARYKNIAKGKTVDLGNLTEAVKNIKIKDDKTINQLINDLKIDKKYLDAFVYFYPNRERYLELNDKKDRKNKTEKEEFTFLENDIKFQLLKIIKQDVNKKMEENKKMIYDPQEYTNKSLVILTENPGYSFDSWIKPEYEVVGNVRKMIDSGYKTLVEWKSVIFQILYTFQCMIKHNINIPNFSIDNLFIQHSKIDPNNSYYSVYNINGIEYYVPYYGDTIVFDILHRDNMNNGLHFGNEK